MHKESLLPGESDFLDPRSHDLDEHHALKMFLGKSTEQAEKMFRENFSFYYEDLLYMRAVSFRFYVLPAIRYLLSADASGDADAVNTFCSVMEARLKTDPTALTPILPVVIDAVRRIVNDFNRYECSPDNYGDVLDRYRAIAERMDA